jgi:hypothetical protein
MKVITETVETTAEIDLTDEMTPFAIPTDFEMPPGGLNLRWPDDRYLQDLRLQDYKGYAAIAFARANRINRITMDSPNARYGIMASGKSYEDIRQALRELGITEEVASLPPGSTNIIFHPFLYGSNVQPTARAGFYRVEGCHTRAHLLRAMYEGVVYGHLSHVEKLRKAGGQINTARLAGGGSRSLVWSQMFADMLQVPIEISDGNELGRGCSSGCRDWRKHLPRLRRSRPGSSETRACTGNRTTHRSTLALHRYQRLVECNADQGSIKQAPIAQPSV